jgi:hypothetical protein
LKKAKLPTGMAGGHQVEKSWYALDSLNFQQLDKSLLIAELRYLESGFPLGVARQWQLFLGHAGREAGRRQRDGLLNAGSGMGGLTARRKGLTRGTHIEADSHIFMTPMNMRYIKSKNSYFFKGFWIWIIVLKWANFLMFVYDKIG